VLALTLNLVFVNNLYGFNSSLPLFSVVVKLSINRGAIEYHYSEHCLATWLKEFLGLRVEFSFEICFDDVSKYNHL